MIRYKAYFVLDLKSLENSKILLDGTTVMTGQAFHSRFLSLRRKNTVLFFFIPMKKIDVSCLEWF